MSDQVTDQSPGQADQSSSEPALAPGRKQHRASREEIVRRLEETRALLRVLMSDSEIKRTLSKAWKVKPRLVEVYLSRARAINRSVVEISENQVLADTVNYWAKRLQNAEVEVQKAGREKAKFQSQLDGINAKLQELAGINWRTLSREERENLRDEQDNLLVHQRNVRDLLRDADTAKMRASMESRDAREHVDRIMGARHPIRIARVNSDGTDIKAMTPGEILEGLRLLGFGPTPNSLPTFENVETVNQQIVVVNGQANGQAGGYTNGHVVHTNGHVNGHTNGHANGHMNGHANGHPGHHNGTNGHTKNLVVPGFVESTTPGEPVTGFDGAPGHSPINPPTPPDDDAEFT